MRETIDAVAYFEIYPAFVDIVVAVVLVNELLGMSVSLILTYSG